MFSCLKIYRGRKVSRTWLIFITTSITNSGNFGRSKSMEDMLDQEDESSQQTDSESTRKAERGKSGRPPGAKAIKSQPSASGDGATGGDKNIRDVVQPLSAIRLRPIRQKTRNAIVSTCIHFIICPQL